MTPSNAKPIFYDMSGRRKRRMRLAMWAFVLLIIVFIIAIIASVLDVRPQPLLNFEVERTDMRPDTSKMPVREAPMQTVMQKVKPLFSISSPPLSVGFHEPWDELSSASLARHVAELDWVVPVWYTVNGKEHTFGELHDPKGRAILAATPRPPKLIPMIQNALNGNWDGEGFAVLLKDPKAVEQLLNELETRLLAAHAHGVFFDFEELPMESHKDYLAFLALASARYKVHGWSISIAVPVGNSDWDLKAYAKVVDKLFLMAYDEHSQESDAGPIASNDWFVTEVTNAAKGADPQKIVVAVGNYAYDWVKGGDGLC